METATMGKVVVTAKIENLEDLYDVGKGCCHDDQVRRIEVHDAVVDTGATHALASKRMVAALGLEPLRTRHSRDSAATSFLPVYGDCAADDPGSRLPCRRRRDRRRVPRPDRPDPAGGARLGHRPQGQRLIGNPDHGGEWGMDAF